MTAKIAVFVQDKFKNGKTDTMMRVIIFQEDNGLWNQLDENYVNMNPETGIGAYREDIKKLIECLADCRIAAGPQFSGVLYRELDNSGFSIFEAQDFSPETLDGILRDLEKAGTEEATTAKAPKCPVETETPGVFYFDFIRLQETFPEMSSKQALRSFLETTPFYELRLKCAHVPPWLEAGPYEMTTESGDDSTMAIIRKKQCGRG
jgi:hypothetical protein